MPVRPSFCTNQLQIPIFFPAIFIQQDVVHDLAVVGALHVFIHFIVSAIGFGCPLCGTGMTDILRTLFQLKESGIQAAVDVLCGTPDGKYIPRNDTAILVIGEQCLRHDIVPVWIFCLIELSAEGVIT